MVNCAKCGKEITARQEIKKGFLMKKTYHKDFTQVEAFVPLTESYGSGSR